MAEPRFAVVMPAHDAAATVGAAVRSVLRQSVADLELVVVDDGSTDETLAALEPFRDDTRLTVIERANGGPSAARNTGIAAASAPVVCFIDSDDLWLPSYLETMGRALSARPGAGFAYTDAWLYDDGRQLVASRSAMAHQRPPVPPPDDARAFLRELLDRNFVYTSAAVPLAVLREVGGYDERVRYGEDFELWLRILGTGRPAVRAPEALAIHRNRPTSLTADVRRYYGGIVDVYRLVLAEHALDAESRAVAERRLAYWEHHLALLDAPPPRWRTSARALARRAAGRRGRWLDVVPEPVATTLSECGVA